jgi:hypothetical protein
VARHHREGRHSEDEIAACDSEGGAAASILARLRASMGERGRMQSQAQDLTGVWNGLYSYPDGRAVTFVATLIESGSILTGSTHEPCVGGDCPAATLFASLMGGRHGSSVTFRKTYEAADPRFRTVNYAGTLNAEATEIEGRWMIPGVWSGKFMMIRPLREALEAEHSQSEKV